MEGRQEQFNFTVPASVSSARRTDPVPSQIAAEANRARRDVDRMKVLKAHYEHRDTGLDDFQLEEITGIKQTSSGKRRGECADPRRFNPVLIEAGERRRSPSKLTNSIVTNWKITRAGVAYYEGKRGQS